MAVGTQTEMPERKLTFGEKAVGLSFNPSGDERVQAVKVAFAQIIDLLNEQRDAYNGLPNEKNRLLSIAITEAQSAQMWAVKAFTWKD